MSLAINVVISDFQQVFAGKETSYVKVSNLCKWWEYMLQIIIFLSDESQ